MIVKNVDEGLAEYTGASPGRAITELDDSRLLVTGDGMTGFVSEDCGKTWGPGFRYTQGGSSMEGVTGGGTSALLQDGRLGMAYSRVESLKGAAGPTRSWFFSTSEDDARSWSAGAPIDLPAASDVEKGFFFQVLWGNLLQLDSGRLIAPAYWEIAGRHPGMPPAGDDPVKAVIQGKLHSRIADGHLYEAANGGCYNYYSDDLGATWTICTGSMMVWPLPSENNIGGFGVCWEPVVMDLKDGRVLMFMRTNVGRMYQSFSSDGGESWSLPEPTELASGDVPCWLGRLRTTGDLIVAWNQSSVEEIEGGYSRGRLCIATSSDEAATWENFRTLELSGGMEARDTVALPPIAHVRAKGDLGVLPDDYTRAHYPRLAFVQGNVIVSYSWDVWEEGELVRGRKFQVIPEDRLDA